MIYHLLSEVEPFSDVHGGALSRWVANVAGSESMVACPWYDTTWNFPIGQIIELPAWKQYGRLKMLYPRGNRIVDILIGLRVMHLLEPLLTLLSEGDIIWVHNRPKIAAYLAQALDKKGLKIVLHMQNSHLATASPKTAAALVKVPVVFCSQFLIDEVMKMHPDIRWRAHLLYNGANERRFHRGVPNHNRVPRVVFVGRLVREKGLHVLFEAMRILQRRNIVAACDVIGAVSFGSARSTKYADGLRKSAPENVNLRGYMSGEELATELRHCDIFCCPSIWEEPFGMVMVEAMASGLPVVASRVGGIPEVLKHGGGRLVPSNDPESLATALESLILDKSARKCAAIEASRSVKAHFSWPVIQSQYLEVLQDVSR